jgi:ADP-ribose pyrophosphatase
MKTFQLPDGRVDTFGTIGAEHTHHIATIALTTDKRVVIARQFRPGPERIFDELPGGSMEPSDKDLEAAARRELREETGYQAGAMEFLGDVYKDAYHNAVWHYFLAWDCTQHAAGQQLDDTEYITVRLISISDLLGNAKAGRMTDCEAVLLAYERLLQAME